MSNSPNLSAGTWLSAIAVAVIGVGAFMYLVMSSALTRDERFFRLDAPGEATFAFEETGEYLIFHEFQRTQDSQGMLRPPGVGALKIGVVNEADRQAVDLEKHEGNTYAIRRTVGESMFAFTVPVPGDYRVTAIHPDGEEAPHTLTIGRSHGQQVVAGFSMGFGVLLVAGGAVAAILYNGSRKRS